MSECLYLRPFDYARAFTQDAVFRLDASWFADTYDDLYYPDHDDQDEVDDIGIVPGTGAKLLLDYLTPWRGMLDGCQAAIQCGTLTVHDRYGNKYTTTLPQWACDFALLKFERLPALIAALRALHGPDGPPVAVGKETKR